jgi:hydroxymethylbilane synthase
VEVRADDEATRALVEAIDHRATHACVAAERHLLEALGGTCRSPVAALADMDEARTIRLRAEILTEDGRESEQGERSFPAGDEAGPQRLAAELLGHASARLRALFGR